MKTGNSTMQHRSEKYEDGFTVLERMVFLSIIFAISALGVFLSYGYVEPVDPMPKGPFVILASMLVGIWVLYGIGVAVKRLFSK